MDKRAILEEIQQYCNPPGLADDEVTVKELADFDDELTPRQAAYRLDRAVRDGVMTRREVQHDGHRCWAYKVKAPSV
jgi:hypothetical protein